MLGWVVQSHCQGEYRNCTVAEVAVVAEANEVLKQIYLRVLRQVSDVKLTRSSIMLHSL